MRDDAESKKSARALLKRHFPNSEIWDGHLLMVTPEFLLAGDFSKVSPWERDHQGLEAFGDAVHDLWAAYSKLSLQAKKAMRFEGKPGAGAPAPTDPTYLRFRQNLMAELEALHRAVLGCNPTRYQDVRGATVDEGMIKRGQRGIGKLPYYFDASRRKEHDQKIQLVETARSVWKHYTGKKAPDKGGAKYLNFVDDLITLAGKQDTEGWSADSATSAWQKNFKALKNGGR